MARNHGIFISQVSRYHARTSTQQWLRNALSIIRRTGYFQYSMLYINLGIFAEIDSRGSVRIVTHSKQMFSLLCIHALLFAMYYLKHERSVLSDIKIRAEAEYLKVAQYRFKKNGKFTRIFGQSLLVDEQNSLSHATAFSMATLTFQDGGYFGFKVI
jgi:hypothetical protein